MDKDQRSKLDVLVLPEHKEEFEKCKADPVYFYNKYIKPPGHPDMTKERYDQYVAQVTAERNMIRLGDFSYPYLSEDAIAPSKD